MSRHAASQVAPRIGAFPAIRPVPHAPPSGPTTGHVHRLGASVLIMASGVFVISLADAAGRSGSASVIWVATYWLGEAIMFAPVVWRALSRSGPGESEAAGLVTGLALATYLVKFIYSPAHFAFPDELQHWRTTVNLLSSHHLFGVNYVLPVSPVYPGLEEVTGALVAVTGLPIFAAGMIVAGLAHLLLTVALYVLFRQVSGSARIAVAACVIYATNPHYQVFDAIYGYQTLALAFFGFALVAVLRLTGRADPAGRARWWILAVALAVATVVTHHVTSYMLVGTLVLLAAVGGARRVLMRRRGAVARRSREDRRTGAARLALLAEICAAFIAVWLRWVAPVTISYLTPTI